MHRAAGRAIRRTEMADDELRAVYDEAARNRFAKFMEDEHATFQRPQRSELTFSPFSYTIIKSGASASVPIPGGRLKALPLLGKEIKWQVKTK